MLHLYIFHFYILIYYKFMNYLAITWLYDNSIKENYIQLQQNHQATFCVQVMKILYVFLQY